MKKSIVFSIVLPLLWLLTTNHVTSTTHFPLKDPSLCLEIDGKILFENTEPGNKCKIALLCDDKIIDSLVLGKDQRKFKVVLKRDLFYTLKIYKSGYIPALICVDTKVPEDEFDLEGLYKFKFSTKLIKTEFSATLNKELLESPIAIISYDDRLERFNYDKNYTSNIKKQVLIKSHFN